MAPLLGECERFALLQRCRVLLRSLLRLSTEEQDANTEEGDETGADADEGEGRQSGGVAGGRVYRDERSSSAVRYAISRKLPTHRCCPSPIWVTGRNSRRWT